MNLLKKPAFASLLSRYGVTSTDFLQRHVAFVLTGFLFLAVVLAINWELFVFPQVEWGDVAANALQVQNAEHFKELLGNYSRWHFHHPGPFFFYLFAFGEILFYNVLHVVPAPLNGEVLAEIIFNVFCLFCSIYIFSTHIRSALFVPLAVLASVLFLFVIESAIPASALVSLWPPYMVLFAFLLLTSACASVATGAWNHLPIMVAAGMMMLHAHVAQLLFVTVLTGVSLTICVLRELRRGTFVSTLAAQKAKLMMSLVILLVFLFPILVDVLLDKPNNLHQIGEYLHTHRGEHNSVHKSLLYLFSFLSFNVTPENILSRTDATFSDLINPDPFVRTYWSFFLCFAVLGVFGAYSARKILPVFLRFLLAEIIAIIVLFLYWSWRITGPMYTFNGFFFFSLQLLALLGIAAVVAGLWDSSFSRGMQTTLACAFTPLLLLIPGLKQGRVSYPDVLPITSAIEHAGVKEAMLIFHAEEWPTAGGVASLMQRAKIGFCVQPEWGFVFGHECPSEHHLFQVMFDEVKTPCVSPCRMLYSRPGLYVTGSFERSSMTLPMLLLAKDLRHESSNFNDSEAAGSWTRKDSSVKFSLSYRKEDFKEFNLGLSGEVFPGRPVLVRFNGRDVARLSVSGPATYSFSVPEAYVENGINTLRLITLNAGPVGEDKRELGFLFKSLQIVGDKNQDHIGTHARISEIPVPWHAIPAKTAGGWHPEGSWTLKGYYPAIGDLTNGIGWGSWSGSDTNTGRIFTTIDSGSRGCFVLAVGHGPSPENQKLTLSTLDGGTLAMFPELAGDGKWKYYEIAYNPTISPVKLVAEDAGTGFGQWLAVGEPIECESGQSQH